MTATEIYDKLTDKAEEITAHVGKVNGRLDKVERDMIEYRLMMQDATKAHLSDHLGKSGMEDFCTGLADIARAVVAKGTGHAYTKAADLLTVSTDGRGGYLVPDDYAGQLDTLLTAYGPLLGAVRFVQAEPQRPFKVPYFSTAPQATWQTTEGGTMTEADAQVSELSLTPKLLGGYCEFSNEMLEVTQSIDFGATVANQLVQSIAEKLEYAILLGDDSAGAYPHDGLLVASGTSSQTALSTPIVSSLWGFVRETLEDLPGLISGNSVIVTTPAAYAAFAANSTTAAYTSMFTNDGGQPRFNGWRVVVSPAAISTTHRVLMFDPSNVWVARSSYRIDTDPYSSFTSNRTKLRVVGFFDYGVPQPANISKAVITALS
jgi:HK97 family phage major capsid protein